jgi:ABC-type sugar transport system ATPase subunit
MSTSHESARNPDGGSGPLGAVQGAASRRPRVRRVSLEWRQGEIPGVVPLLDAGRPGQLAACLLHDPTLGRRAGDGTGD